MTAARPRTLMTPIILYQVSQLQRGETHHELTLAHIIARGLTEKSSGEEGV